MTTPYYSDTHPKIEQMQGVTDLLERALGEA